MQVGLKIWRFNSRSGRAGAPGVRDRRARGGDAPRLPRHRQGPPRRVARLPEELPDDDLRLVRHADGRRRGARLQGAHVRRRAGGARAGHLGDGEPADRQGPRRRHGPVLGQVQVGRPVPAAGLPGAAGRPRAPDPPGAHERDPQGVALHQLRLLRLRVQRDGVGPDVHRPAGAREGDALRRRSARRPEARAAREAERRARHLGVHPLLLLQRALPEGRRSARRDREARRRVDEGGHRPRHGREAREVVRHLGEDDRLAARDRARPEDAGRRRRDQADAVRPRPRGQGQGAAAVPAARREGRARRRGACTTSRCASPAAAATTASCRASTRSRASRTAIPARRRSRRSTSGPARSRGRTSRTTRHEEGRLLQGLPRVAVGEGARLRDAGARAEGRAGARSSSSRSPAAAPATSTRRSPTTTCT